MGEKNLRDRNNFVFIGESGSGKTENALYFATKYLNGRSKKITFFDMDQTKGMFRSRDYEDVLKEHGVKLMETTTFLDAPVIPTGVTGALLDDSSINIFDVGGNEIGARMIGQFSHMLNNQKTKVFYVINPYRYFSKSGAEIIDRMNEIVLSCRLYDADVVIISNPCLGDGATLEEVLRGHLWLKDELMQFGYNCTFLSVDELLVNEIKWKVKEQVLPLKVYIQYP